LEEEEQHIPNALQVKINAFGNLSLLEHLFHERYSKYFVSDQADCLTAHFPREELVQCLVDVLIRWRIRSQPSLIPIKKEMHHLIALGVGHLDTIVPTTKFDPDTNYPVYICEPLIVLSLSSLFEEHSWTTRKTWITNSIRTTHNQSSLGYMLKHLTLLVLVENFGGKFTPLRDVFHFGKSSSSLGSRKVTLVLLQWSANDVMCCCSVSWKTGSSNCFGFKAESPTDILKYLKDPNGKAFLFPDTHLGPDLMWFFQDQETGELIVAFAQNKVSKELDSEAWIWAVDSVMPAFFCTMVVCPSAISSSHST